MKYHVVTALLLLAAAVLYVAGFATGTLLVLAAAVAFEIYFWMRVVRGRSRSRPPAIQPR